MEKINDYEWEIAKEGNMKVPGKIFTSDKLRSMLEDGSINQVKNVAELPGIQKMAMAMPDMHYGYGFPIGGVAAFDYEEGIITPGGIGFDINCGVRLLSTNLNKDDVYEKIKELIGELFRAVPSGVGGESKVRLSDEDYKTVLERGAEWAVLNNLGNDDDLLHCEENGAMKGGDINKISGRAMKRGRKQLGTLGAGNHFLEVQAVDEIYDKETAERFGINQEGQVMLMIHCGSRGLGHQTCSDYLRKMEDEFPDIMESLPEKDLIYASANSKLARDYFSAMVCAANYAWCNRHIIGHFSKESVKKVFPGAQIKTVYDVAHNIAKIEEHEIDGVKKKVWMHRKGATRAFPPGHEDVPEAYRETGQPVLIPGSMGTASYVLKGTEEGFKKSFGSTAHGAGRTMSRFAAKKEFQADKVRNDLAKEKIYIKAASMRGISEEAPGVYKDIDEVIKVSDGAGLAKKVAKLRPICVIKG
mgnify:FL=1